MRDDTHSYFELDPALKSLLAAAVHFSPFPILITDREGVIGYVNPMFAQITGYTLDELKGKTPRILKSSQTSLVVHEELWATILSGRIWSGEVCNKKKNGEEFWESISIHSIKDANGSITHFVSIWQDITKRRKYDESERLEKETYEKQSRTDDLTGLYNRRHIFVELEREVQRALRYKRSLVGMMLDIDNFKQINDQYGHFIGDRVIRSFARVLEKSVRTIDILGRYGGDEFLLILPETGSKEARVIAERIQKNVHDYQTHVLIEFGSFTTSIGLVALDESCRGSKALFFEKIDNVLLLAKRAGKNTIVTE
jgi:diguanylate cyclase (GGDEF)-like protein/PAS domain S-box-containing protein